MPVKTASRSQIKSVSAPAEKADKTSNAASSATILFIFYHSSRIFSTMLCRSTPRRRARSMP